MTGWRVMVGIAVLSAFRTADAQPASSKPARLVSRAQEVLKLEDDWAAGLIRRDTAMFRQILAPNFVYTENGDVMNKKQVIAGVVGFDTVTAAANEGMEAHSYGNTIVVTGILAERGRGKGGAFSRRYRFTDTWLRTGRVWQIIAAQDYVIPK